MPSAHLIIDPRFTAGSIDRRLFGGFVEHLGRHIYDGIHEPAHATADANGFRTDVIELVKELGVSTIRYPGGNFVSGYRWEDGVGPIESRPRRLDLAWHVTETNEVGLHEFATWLDAVGSDLMLAVNLGTRGTQEALDLLEYSNIRAGTALSQQRIDNGRIEPFGVDMWCLGNEMDGPWQLGHRNADDYGKLAARTAKAMRQMYEGLQLVVCGSSHSAMPTFGAWEHTVLEHCYDDVDFISCHAYYSEKSGDLDSFLASPIDMDHFIESVVATADSVGAQLRNAKRINISFDEWNVWFPDPKPSGEQPPRNEHWPIAPRQLENVYSVADAVVVGGLLMSLLRHADRVKSASLAQLVNVIGPIMTEPGGAAWRQTTYFPFATMSRLARGEVLELRVTTESYETELYGSVPVVDAVATYDGVSGAAAVFLVNRSVTDAATVTADLTGFGDLVLAEATTLCDDDVYARNSLDNQTRVRPVANGSARLLEGTLTALLPPASWSAISLTR